MRGGGDIQRTLQLAGPFPRAGSSSDQKSSFSRLTGPPLPALQGQSRLPAGLGQCLPAQDPAGAAQLPPGGKGKPGMAAGVGGAMAAERRPATRCPLACWSECGLRTCLLAKPSPTTAGTRTSSRSTVLRPACFRSPPLGEGKLRPWHAVHRAYWPPSRLQSRTQRGQQGSMLKAPEVHQATSSGCEECLSFWVPAGEWRWRKRRRGRQGDRQTERTQSVAKGLVSQAPLSTVAGSHPPLHTVLGLNMQLEGKQAS